MVVTDNIIFRTYLIYSSKFMVTYVPPFVIILLDISTLLQITLCVPIVIFKALVNRKH